MACVLCLAGPQVLAQPLQSDANPAPQEAQASAVEPAPPISADTDGAAAPVVVDAEPPAAPELQPDGDLAPRQGPVQSKVKRAAKSALGNPERGAQSPAALQDNQSDAALTSAPVAADLDAEQSAPKAANIDLRQVVDSPVTDELFKAPEDEAMEASLPINSEARLSANQVGKTPNQMRRLLGVDVPPATTTRLDWTPSKSFSGMAVDTPVLVVNGAWDGPTLCLTAAIHGDELNGIEMVRRVLYDLDPAKLHGMVVGVPIVNLLGFSRNSRYLPDRRDLNRYFPGNPRGSVASRLAHAFFNDLIMHCNALVDLHTGSFYRTNITQLRADMRKPLVADFAELFGDIPVLNTGGNGSSLRAAAVRAGIPTVTLEAGEPMRMQVEVVEEGVKAINTLLEKNGMYPSFSLWAKPSPAYYRSSWVRANASGILFSRVKLGGRVKKGDKLGEVINPVTNEKKSIISVHDGRVLGMALDQFVLPGFAAYHIGIREPRALAAKAMGAAEDDAESDDDGQLDSENKPPVLEEPKPMSPEEEGFDDE